MRAAVLGAGVALAGGCDAILGLGDAPTSAADDAPSSTGATSTGDVTASSATSGGDGGGPSSSSSGGPGGGGAGGAGGTGGGGAAYPCGFADDVGCEAHEGDRCVRRVHDPIPIGVDPNLGQHAVLNRLGRGLAVTRDVAAFWARDADGAGASVYVLDRETGQLDGDPVQLSSGFPTIAATPSGRIFLADDEADLEELVRGENGWSLVNVVAPYNLPGVGASGRMPGGLLLSEKNGGATFFLDPDAEAAPTNPCRVDLDSLGATPIDARVRSLAGTPVALVLALSRVDGGLPFSGARLEPCPNGAYEVGHVADGATGMAISAFGERLYVKYVTSEGDPRVVEVDHDGVVLSKAVETNVSRALDATADGVLVPGREGGLGRCPADLSEECTPLFGPDLMGQVHVVEARGTAFVAAGLGIDAPEVILACFDAP